MRRRVGIVAATLIEVRVLLGHLKRLSGLMEIGHLSVQQGTLGDRLVLVAISGVGKANAAVASTLLVAKFQVEHLVSIGIAGAYPSSGLSPRDVVVATSEIYADEGCLSQKGWLSMEEIGRPLVEVQGERFYDAFLMYVPSVCSLPHGPFLTLSAVTGTREVLDRLTEQFPRALCETMEGAAVAHVATLWQVPCTEVRGVSNMVGHRYRESWLVDEAAENAQREVLRLIERNSL